MSTEPNSIVITGANGLLGKALCETLLAENFKIFALVKKVPDKTLSGIEYVSCDFTNDLDVLESLGQVDVVVHLAQSHRFRDFPDGAEDIFAVNVASTHKLLEYARKSSVSHFVYASTGGIYLNGKSAITENSPISSASQLGPYFGSKMCGEILTQNYSSCFFTSIIRPFFIYGAGQNRSMLIPRLYDKVSNSEPIELQGQNGIKINPIHVKDAARTVFELIRKPQSTTFNMAGSDRSSNR
jgi:UDP-glucose 4-epimerase